MSWGDKIKISLFGESHGEAIGVVIEGLPAGFKPDLEKVALMMRRRAPGNFPWATSRKEPDEPRIISGFFNGAFTGAPLTALIANTNTRSTDYAALAATPRPGHADYAASIRYNSANDPRGGGHFSARLTAPLVFAGALAQQILAAQDIAITARILEIAGIADPAPAAPPFNVAHKDFPCADDTAAAAMIAAIADAHARRDSVGGIVEVAAVGFPAGIGDPFFGKLDAKIAGLLMTLPAVKAVEIGAGFAAARSTGSANNDQTFFNERGAIARATNNAGGIEGGISNGEPIIVRAAFKPTPSISAPQRAVNLADRATTTIEIHGRHDPCVVPRAVPVVEAALALALFDAL